MMPAEACRSWTSLFVVSVSGRTRPPRPEGDAMTNFLFAYTGGSMPETEQEQAAVMAAWGAWFGQLGEAVVDGGNPTGASASVASDGSVRPAGVSALTGYSIVAADSLPAAADLAKGCPILTSGGGVDVYEIVPAM
jgi:hypothetical protein